MIFCQCALLKLEMEDNNEGKDENYRAGEISKILFPKPKEHTFKYCKLHNVGYLQGDFLLISRHKFCGECSFLAKHYVQKWFPFDRPPLIKTNLFNWLTVRYLEEEVGSKVIIEQNDISPQ